jgi:hypothetical protein
VTLTLIENAGFGFAEINKLAPHLSMKPKASSKKDLKDFDFKRFGVKMSILIVGFFYTE